YPEAAIDQCELLNTSEADVCSGAVDQIDESGRHLRRLTQPATTDLVVATLTPSRNTLPTAHVFRRRAVESLRWDEALCVRQDTDWMMRLCAANELRWLRIDSTV